MGWLKLRAVVSEIDDVAPLVQRPQQKPKVVISRGICKLIDKALRDSGGSATLHEIYHCIELQCNAVKGIRLNCLKDRLNAKQKRWMRSVTSALSTKYSKCGKRGSLTIWCLKETDAQQRRGTPNAAGKRPAPQQEAVVSKHQAVNGLGAVSEDEAPLIVSVAAMRPSGTTAEEDDDVPL